jgi:hypothetical protein
LPRSRSEIFRPNISPEDAVKAALWNVDYHLGAVIHFHQQPSMGALWKDDASIKAEQKLQLQAEVNKFYAHLRAFFWELDAAFDLMQIWIKGAHGRESDKWAELEKARVTDWFKDSSAYRNFSHESFLVSEGIFQTSSQKIIARNIAQPARKGRGQPMIPDTLVEYRNEIQTLFNKLKRPTEAKAATG